MDNFSGQTTHSVLEKVEEEGIVVVMVPPGTTDRLQPLDVNTNKSAKDFLRENFRHWYAAEVQKRLQAGVEETALHIDMGMPVMKEAGAQWLTALYDKLCTETSIITNGFRKVGITDVVRKAREASSSDEESIEDPFDSCTEQVDAQM